MILNRISSLLFVGAAVFLAGCGILEVPKTSTITGRITDLAGMPVRNARVYTIDGETQSSSNGSYTLPMNREDFLTVFAEINQDGVTYKGRTVVRTVQDQTQLSANVVVAPISTLSRIHGRVTDSFGAPIVNARVYAYTTGYLSSAMVSTDVNGFYNLEDLIGGRQYTVQAGAVTYSNDTVTVTMSNGDDRVINFSLFDSGTPTLPQVTGVTARTWVSQPIAFRGGIGPEAYEAIKRRWSPNRADYVATSRTSSSGAPIEVELNWNRLQGDDFQGYGVYRGTGTGTITDYDYYREPMAGTYIDSDVALNPNALYRYQLTALGTDFPNNGSAEGPRSVAVDARTLDDLIATVNQTTGLRFNWNNDSGATSFVIYIFDRIPGVGVTSIWNNETSRASGTSFVYDTAGNPAGLTTSRTYWYVVLGLANSDSSRTLSTIGSFTY